MALIEHGTLHLDLYHGTSSLNLPSIREHGLGGCNLIAELDVISFLVHLYSVAQAILPADHAEWCLAKVVMEPMVKQRVAASGFNYRHGQTYLTPSQRTAINYAVNNAQGSELLSNVKHLQELVASVDPSAASRITLGNPALKERFQRTGKPIVIRISHLPVAMLRSESGGNANEVVQKIEALMSTPGNREVAEAMCQQCNFELHGVVPFDLLRCYEVSSSNDHRYTLLEVASEAL
ncbi:MAG: hypothetical protein WBD40_04945 [Tepidisphaeraceae bacterium]